MTHVFNRPLTSIALYTIDIQKVRFKSNKLLSDRGKQETRLREKVCQLPEVIIYIEHVFRHGDLRPTFAITKERR